jgi:ubiquinone/menaquinone biosynthesis C-methylase UbiE
MDKNRYKENKMPNHAEIYRSKAEKYEQLILREDYLCNIKLTLSEICSFTNCDAIDMGAGTGRLTCMFAPMLKSITAYDLSQTMLDVTANKLRTAGLTNWTTQVADHRSLPIENNSVDIIMAGWSICYLGEKNVPDWQDNIKSVLSEMKRVVKQNGTLIILETLGTGTEKPEPLDSLVGYFRLLEEFGFSHKMIRTDYQFVSIEEAQDLIKFFFGDELANKIQKSGLTILPECTGVWWLKV